MTPAIAKNLIMQAMSRDVVPTFTELAHAESTMRLCGIEDFGLRTEYRTIEYTNGRLRVYESDRMIFPICEVCERPAGTVRWREEFRLNMCFNCGRDKPKTPSNTRTDVRIWRTPSHD